MNSKVDTDPFGHFERKQPIGHYLQVERAAQAAGAWWAERLSDEYASHRPAFAAAVAALVARELRGEIGWDMVKEERPGCTVYTTVMVEMDPPQPRGVAHTEFDYDPDALLTTALFESIPATQTMSKWEIGTLLPRKHSLMVKVDRLIPKEGYGRFRQDIILGDLKELEQ